ncbi:NUR1 Nuclear rim protein 1 [Candida maltosa Xu316]|uniref:Nuclear rim protein 1 n=1 Tax=Candida maltosa (strain Xu316) TaxID=1245528 RepID=M3JZ78_CANMX|nr:hypothetical protein G210_1128 [Candida maltosa Xu316]
MSKKLIRKQSLVSKIQSFPFDLWLYFHELQASIDWDDYNYIIALPLGIILTVIFFITESILNYYNYINQRSKNVLFNSDYYQYEYLKNDIINNTFDPTHIEIDDSKIETPITTSILWAMNGINSTILILCVVITVKLFTAKRNYGLLYCKMKPKSKNVFKSTLDQISFFIEILAFFLKFFQNDEDDEDEEDETYEGDTTVEMAGENEIWHLNVWNPSKFALYLFIGLNPINLYMIYYLISDVSHLYLIALLVIISGFIYIFVEKFLNLINDKQILYQEMFQEYNKKFVQPKINVLKKDAMIDATMGPYYSSSLNDNRPYAFSKSKIFTTHDIKGNKVTEYGEIDSQVLPQQLEPATSVCSSVMNSQIPSRRNSVFYEDTRSRQNNFTRNTPSTTFIPTAPRYSATSTQSPTMTSNLSFNRFERTPSPQRRSPQPRYNDSRSGYANATSPGRLSPARQPNLEFSGFGSSRETSPNRFKPPSPVYRNLMFPQQSSSPHQQQYQQQQQQQQQPQGYGSGYSNPFRSPSPTRRRPSDSPGSRPGWR